MTRRALLQMIAASPVVAARSAIGAQSGHNAEVAYGHATLSAGIRSRFAKGVNGTSFHVLECGYETPGRPCVLLVHGFPELAYSWRRIMLPIARAGFHVLAPDLRGYGRSGGTDVQYDDDLTPFSTFNRVRDMLGLVSAFGYRAVAGIVGHDYGSPVSAWCALTRPDVFRSVVLMSAPFAGPPSFPFNTLDASGSAGPPTGRSVDADLAALPQPRRHYQAYYSTREANANMWRAPQGVHDFLRAYYHFKSADWTENRPHPLSAFNARELAKLPRYYVMDRDTGMAETVAPHMPSAAHIAACRWLTDEELRVYSGEYGRTGFQGGLQSYRIGQDPKWSAELTLFAGRTIDVPSMFVSGKSDWGVYQRAGAFEAMTRTACTQMRGVHLLEGAGHWVQQEQAQVVAQLLVEFLKRQA